MLFARSTRCHETTEQLFFYEDLFLFLRDTSRGLSRLFPRNKPPTGRQVLRYTPVAGPVYATSETLQSYESHTRSTPTFLKL
jgi:hypothetical protein